MSDGFQPPPFPGSENPSAPVPPSPKRRTWRTVVQTVLAVLVAVPSAVAALTQAGVELSVRATALVVGIAAALVILISAAQNAWDQRKGLG